MCEIILIAHNVRSAHNVGSLLRSSEGLGVKTVYLTGYTPYPRLDQDPRLPHLADKIHRQIRKTALGAEDMLTVIHSEDVKTVIKQLKNQEYEIAALEQSESSIPLPEYKPSAKTALLVGNEVDGLDSNLLTLASVVVEIPMRGRKESFNVAQAAAMAMYQLMAGVRDSSFA